MLRPVQGKGGGISTVMPRGHIGKAVGRSLRRGKGAASYGAAGEGDWYAARGSGTRSLHRQGCAVKAARTGYPDGEPGGTIEVIV